MNEFNNDPILNKIINEIKKGFYKIDISTNNEFFYIHQKNSQKYTSNEIKNSILLSRKCGNNMG